jgi:hypothetical protein
MDTELLRILACPLCHGAVTLGHECLVCAACGRRYLVKDGIPIMVVQEPEIYPSMAKTGDE